MLEVGSRILDLGDWNSGVGSRDSHTPTFQGASARLANQGLLLLGSGETCFWDMGKLRWGSRAATLGIERWKSEV